jgi:hypothetical protein
VDIRATNEWGISEIDDKGNDWQGVRKCVHDSIKKAEKREEGTGHVSLTASTRDKSPET